jgi:hypothetical protein
VPALASAQSSIQLERMLDPGKIGLRRKCEQVGLPCIRLRQQRLQRRLVDAQLGAGQRRVVHPGPAALCEFPHAVDRVVVVGGQQKPATRRQRVGLADQLERARGVEREDRRVVTSAAKIVENRGTRLLDPARGLRRARVDRMRVAEHLLGQHRRMLLHLTGGIQAAAGVVQVDLILTVEPAVLRGAQVVEGQGRGVVRKSGQEIFVRRHGQGLSRPPAAAKAQDARITPQATRGPELPVGWVL